MSNIVNQLLETASPYQSVQKDAARLAGKWAKSGLLEGINGDVEKGNMSILLENQAKQLVVEASSTGTGANFTPGTGEQYAAVALPLVRKVFGQIAAKEFVSVQPMTLPAGLVFFLDFQYGDTKIPFSANDSMYGDASENFGNTNTGGLYGPGRFGYSINDFSASVVDANHTIDSASFADVNFDADLSASVAAGDIAKITVKTGSLSGVDVDGIRGFYLEGANGALPPITAADNFPALAKLDATENGSIDFFVSASGGVESDEDITVHYNKQTDFNARGDFEDGAAYSDQAGAGRAIDIPEINVQMKSETIAAKTRKLKAQWTPEFSQDLNAFHSLDAEAELTSILSEYISLEIDLEILGMLIENVPSSNTAVWSAKVGNELNTAGTAIVSNTSGVYYTQMSWFQTLGIKLQKVSNLIHQKTLRGGANFMVVSPTVATVLESIPGFAADSDGDAAKMQYAFGVQKVGALNSRYKVYKNPYMKENFILLGFKGNQFLEAGAVYAPYIPLIMTPLVYDPNTFTPRKGIMTRYAKKMVRPEFYGGVKVADLNVV
tara:strand:+ start:1381 stop:3033 length:1653 start_codon:yes stop_codon:yes gene_type:complete